jgi:DDE superfamily endonuclease
LAKIFAAMVSPPPASAALLERFDSFVEPLLTCVKGKSKRRLAQQYARGLLGPSERKTAAPLARQMRGVESAPALERDVRGMLSDEPWDAACVMLRGARQLLRQSDGWPGVGG